MNLEQQRRQLNDENGDNAKKIQFHCSLDRNLKLETPEYKAGIFLHSQIRSQIK